MKQTNLFRNSLFVFIILILAAGALYYWQNKISKTVVSVSTDLLDDQGNLLTPNQKQHLHSYLEFVRSNYEIDFRILTLASVNGKTLESFSAEKFQQMGIGMRTQGKGLLLVLALKSAETRVEVGYALEPFITDRQAAELMQDYVRPYFQNHQSDASLEAAAEILINFVKHRMDELSQPLHVQGSGGAGNSANLLGKISSALTDDDRKRLESIMIAQETPEASYRLELAMLEKGFYIHKLNIFDSDWKKKGDINSPPSVYQSMSRTFNQPFKTLIEADHALIFYPDQLHLGPVFLDKVNGAWIINRTLVMDKIRYSMDNSRWFAQSGSYPHFDLLQKAFHLKRIDGTYTPN